MKTNMSEKIGKKGIRREKNVHLGNVNPWEGCSADPLFGRVEQDVFSSWSQKTLAYLCASVWMCVFMLQFPTVSVWQITQVGSRGCLKSRLLFAMFTINMLITYMRCDTDTCGMKCTIFPPWLFDFYPPPFLPCASPVVCESCGGKLVVRSKQDKLTVSRCARKQSYTINRA